MGRQSLYDAIKCGPLGNPDLDPSLNASDLFELYDTTLLDITDQFAPLHSVVSAIDHCRHGLTPSAEPPVDIVECSKIDIVDRRIRGPTDVDRCGTSKAPIIS